MSWSGGERRVRLSAGIAFVMSWAAAAARAAEPWPADVPDWISRDEGAGLSFFPLLCWWAWVAGWAGTSSWLCRDAPRFKVRPVFWTNWAVFPFLVCGLVAWWIPWSAVGQAIMALGWLLPLVLYARERNPKAPANESIFTRDHLGRAWRSLLRRLGMKVAAEEVVTDGLPWVRLSVPAAATPAETEKKQKELENTEGFPAAMKLLQEAAAARATSMIIEAAADGLRIGHDVDGIVGPARGVKTPAKGMGKSRQAEIWGDAPPLEAKAGNAALAVLRTLAGGDAAKSGGFTIEVDGKKRACQLSSRATAAGKQMVLTIDAAPFAPKTLEDLGMSPELANQVRDLIAREKGLFLISSPPASGCTTTFDTVLLTADRLLRDFVSIENAAAPAKEIQNVKPVRYSTTAGETAVTALDQAMLEYPRAIVTRDLVDKALAARLMNLADDQQFVLVSLRATDAVDAIHRLLKAGIAPDQLGRCLLGSLSVRLVRKLCESCGETVPTPAKLLAQMKKTAEQVPQIRQPSSRGGCRKCAGRQFSGRTGIFELAAGPTLRHAISQGGDAKLMRQAAIKDGMRSLADGGLGMVAAGASAYEEMQRVFAAKKEPGPAGVGR